MKRREYEAINIHENIVAMMVKDETNIVREVIALEASKYQKLKRANKNWISLNIDLKKFSKPDPVFVRETSEGFILLFELIFYKQYWNQ